jgi:hypothetical protein
VATSFSVKASGGLVSSVTLAGVKTSDDEASTVGGFAICRVTVSCVTVRWAAGASSWIVFSGFVPLDVEMTDPRSGTAAAMVTEGSNVT